MEQAAPPRDWPARGLALRLRGGELMGASYRSGRCLLQVEGSVKYRGSFLPQNVLRPRQLPLGRSFASLPLICLWGFLACCTFIQPPSLTLLSASPRRGSLSLCGGMPGMALGCKAPRGYLRCWEAAVPTGEEVLQALPECRGGSGELVPLCRPSEELRELALREAFLPLSADLCLSDGVSEAVLEVLLPFEFMCRLERFLTKLCERGEEFLEWLMEVSW